MADEPSAGELDRRFTAHELRTDRQHAELEAHINRVAADSVPLGVYQADQRAAAQQQAAAQRDHDADIAQVRAENVEAFRQLREDVIKPIQDRLGMSVTRWVGILGVAVAFAGVIVTAWATSKGAH